MERPSLNVDKEISRHGRLITQIFELFLNEPEKFCGLLPERKNINCTLGNLQRSKDGHFRVFVEPTQLSAAISVHFGVTEFPHIPSMYSLERISRHLHIPRALIGPFGAYSLESNTLEIAHKGGWLAGALLGIPHITDSAKNSVVEIIIQSLDGTNTGTGFISISDNRSLHIFTCKHNLISDSGTSFLLDEVKNGSLSFEVEKVLIFDRIDVAIISLALPCDILPISFSHGRILEKVVSVGYPRIHLTEASPLLFHSGEVNGWTGSLERGSRFLVTSCDVAPGSSGGPLINELGLAVGIVSRRTETASQGGMANYSLAVPFEAVVHEITSKAFQMHVLSNRRFVPC